MTIDLRMHAPLTTNIDLAAGFGSPTFTRSSIATIVLEGVLETKAINVPRFTGQAYFSEGASTNLCLQSRDMTVTWVPFGGTLANDALGLDGVINAASSLTAVVANGSGIQTITLAATTHTYSVDIRRRTGTGTVEISDDFFATSLDVTALINSSTYTRVSITGTNVDPTIGVRLGTIGDAVELDYNQLETLGVPSSRIETVASTVTRDEDALDYDSSNWPPLNTEFTLAINMFSKMDGVTPGAAFEITGVTGNADFGVNIVDDWRFRFAAVTSNDGTNVPTSGTFRVLVTWVSGGNQLLFTDTVLEDTDAAGVSTGAVTVLRVGRVSAGINNFYGEISDIRIYNNALTQQEIDNEICPQIDSLINTQINDPINTCI